MAKMTDGSIKISASHGQKLLAILTAEREEIAASLGQKEAEILDLMKQLNAEPKDQNENTLLEEIAKESAGGRRPKGETRRMIIEFLAVNGPSRLTAITKGLNAEISTVSRNLFRLENEGLVSKDKEYWTATKGADLL